MLPHPDTPIESLHSTLDLNQATHSGPSPPIATTFDVCIIGAGPAGLACLSAIREPYSVDHLTEMQIQRALRSQHQNHRPLSVCVIDPQLPQWLHTWRMNFDQLRIQHLRSPAMAHPDAFDTNALLAFATQQEQHDKKDKRTSQKTKAARRGKNKKDKRTSQKTIAESRGKEQQALLDSGCCDLKQLDGLGAETHVGLWKLPSNTLFLDFCTNLADRLPHKQIQGYVKDIQWDTDSTNVIKNAGKYQVHWSSSMCPENSGVIAAHNVILATGKTGKPIIPPGLTNCPNVYSWTDPEAFPAPLNDTSLSQSFTSVERVLVIGGGLTAVQAALRVLDDGHECVLCSRRPLQEKHFDIPVTWFDRRTTHQHLSKLYHDTPASRLEQLQKARDGGSVPPMYLERLTKYSQNKSLVTWVGEVDNMFHFQGSPHEFQRVILACGIGADCRQHPVAKKVLEKCPIPVHGGLPFLTQDLQWKEDERLFVVGALAALQIGPDAGNLMGIRRAATVVANALDCRSWLRQKALANPFDALSLWNSDSDTEPESDSIDECASCAGGDSCEEY